MSFGTELKDQVSTINQLVQNGIQFLNELRDYVKERAQIEKEYSGKLDALAKKYAAKKDKKTVAISVGDGPISPTSPTEPTSSHTSTFMKAWAVLLQETEGIAKKRLIFSEALAVTISEEIKNVMIRKEDARKKHMSFAQKLELDRDKIYAERQKAKSRYDDSCAEATTSLMRQEKSPEDEKAMKQAMQDVIERNNNKNLYVLSVRVANSHKKKYYNTDLPALTDHLQRLNESRIDDVKRIWEELIDFEQTALDGSQEHLDVIRQTLDEVDAQADSKLFITYNKKDWEEPPNFAYELSSNMGNDTAELLVDANAEVFLKNKLAKARNQVASLSSVAETKKKEIDGMRSLESAYRKNTNLGDPETVGENLLNTYRELTTLESHRNAFQTEIDSIADVIGELGPDDHMHEFRSASFKIPTTCDLCQASIWGLSKQGHTCKKCGYNCHSRCEMMVPANCSKRKGRVDRGPVASMIILSPGSPSNTERSYPKYTSPAMSVTTETSSIIDRGDLYFATVLYDHVAADPIELTVSEGDRVMVLEPEEGGWVKVSFQGREGLVPASYIQIEYSSSKVRVLYDYTARSSEELTIRVNDIITVMNRDTDGDWWDGVLNGHMGRFPATYVEEYAG